MPRNLHLKAILGDSDAGLSKSYSILKGEGRSFWELSRDDPASGEGRVSFNRLSLLRDALVLMLQVGNLLYSSCGLRLTHFQKLLACFN